MMQRERKSFSRIKERKKNVRRKSSLKVMLYKRSKVRERERMTGKCAIISRQRLIKNTFIYRSQNNAE